MAVQAPRRPAYKPFHVMVEGLVILPQRSHHLSPLTCGRMMRFSMLGRSAMTQFSPWGFSHFARHNISGTRTWSMMGTGAMRSFVFGGPTSPWDGLLRLM